jgi:hypothetical protein
MNSLLTSFLAGCFECTDDIPQRYDSAECKPVLRNYGNEFFILVKCGLVWTDVLDTAEWETNILAGDVLLSPKFGNFNIGEATTNQLATTGAGVSILDVSEYPFEYITTNTALDRSDEDWFQSLYENFNSYTLIPADINEGLAFNKDILELIRTSQGGGGLPVAGTDIGFRLSLTTVPQFVPVNGSGFAGQWKVNGYFREDAVLRYAEIAGLPAIFAANA